MERISPMSSTIYVRPSMPTRLQLRLLVCWMGLATSYCRLPALASHPHFASAITPWPIGPKQRLLRHCGVYKTTSGHSPYPIADHKIRRPESEISHCRTYNQVDRLTGIRPNPAMSEGTYTACSSRTLHAR